MRALLVLLCAAWLGAPLHASAEELPVARPEEVGLSGPRLERVRQVLQRHVEAGRLSGGVAAVVRRGRAVPLAPVGSMDLESRRPMRADAIFRIYSMSKPITSVAALMLVEEGKLRLTDPVSRYVPELAKLKVLKDPMGPVDQVVDAEREITIRDLLTHTSGLTYAFMGQGPLNAAYEQITGPLGKRTSDPLSVFVRKLSALPLAYPPGAKWNYSVSTDVLGHVVAVVSGMPFDAFLRERIFVPLDMRDTDFWVPAEKLDRLVANYRSTDDGRLELVDAAPHSSYAERPAFLSGGGGLVSTARDYARFAQMLLAGGELEGRRLLARKTIEHMRLDHLSQSQRDVPFLREYLPGTSFGLGVSVVVDPARYGRVASAGAYGWGGAAGTHFWIDPAEELLAVILVQNMSPRVLALPPDVETAVYQALTD